MSSELFILLLGCVKYHYLYVVATVINVIHKTHERSNNNRLDD